MSPLIKFDNYKTRISRCARKILAIGSCSLTKFLGSESHFWFLLLISNVCKLSKMQILFRLLMCSYSNKIYLIDISIKFSYLQHYALCNFLSSDVSEVKENPLSYHLENYSPSKNIKIKAVLTIISVFENK